MNRKFLQHSVARAAARQLPVLPPAERVLLIQGLALLLPDPRQKALARYTAALIRQSEDHLARLLQELNSEPVSRLPKSLRH